MLGYLGVDTWVQVLQLDVFDGTVDLGGEKWALRWGTAGKEQRRV